MEKKTFVEKKKMFNNFVSENRNQYKVTDFAKFVRKAKYQK